MITLKKYCNKFKNLFTEKESFIYEIKTEDGCEDFRSDKEMFDLVIIQLSQYDVMIQTYQSLEK